jgi:hypothetical protein
VKFVGKHGTLQRSWTNVPRKLRPGVGYTRRERWRSKSLRWRSEALRDAPISGCKPSGGISSQERALSVCAMMLTPNAWSLQGVRVRPELFFGKESCPNQSDFSYGICQAGPQFGHHRVQNFNRSFPVSLFGEGGSCLSPAAYRAGLSFQKTPFTFDRV